MSYQHKRSSVAGKVPKVSDFGSNTGQLIINTADGKIYMLVGSAVKSVSIDDTIIALINAVSDGKLDKTDTAVNSDSLDNKTAAQWQAEIDAKAGIYTGSTRDEVNFPVGWEVITISNSIIARNTIIAPRIHTANTDMYTVAAAGAILTGKWVSGSRSGVNGENNVFYYKTVRIE